MDLWEDKPPFCLGKKASLFAVGDPIYPLIGSSSYDVDLDAGLGGLKLRYDMRRKLPMDKQELAYPYAALPSFGPLVESSLHKRLIYQSGTGANMQASRGLGRWVSFAVTGGVFVPDPGVRDKLVAISGGWRYVDAQTRAEETYDSTGRLNTEKRADGTVLTYGYSTAAGEDAPAVGYLLTVQDQLGHLVKFKYDASGVITQVTRVDGQVIGAAYTGGNLSQLTWPDGKYLQFIYDKPGLAWALTGVVDEEGKRRVSFGYDDLGRATSTEEGTGFNKYTASWDAGMEPGWNITEEYDSVNNVIWIHHRWKNVGNAYVQGPLGYSNTVGASIVNGMSYASSQTQPGGSGCSAASSSQTFDANANVTSRVDFAGNRSCMAYDASNRETVRVEGLKTADTCPADVASYTASNPGPAKPQRKISTQWHPQWNLQTQVVEPNLITTTVYNDQTDLVDPAHPKLNCAPSAPALPDGSKIAVVCKRYEQATTDTLGDLSAANATVTDSRSWSYSYNQYGQVLTETDPRGKATTYEYWTEPTSFTGDGAAARGHTLGDLKTVTQGPNTANPLKTQYTEYNKLGQVLTTVLPNGSTESREYHLRGWLTKLTQTPAGGGTGLVTQYDYYATGLLKQVTQADGSWTLNTYDDAHRLTDVSSSDGNSEHYELDNAGNRTTESYYKGTDPATRTLVKTVTRTYDALGRMQSVSGLR
ncbi:hypothetical protein LRH25_32385 [Ideonella azotifigens]|uniref:RHS repeat protein n=1 Tax=Ideonella azotifigens TaxID=513160 RepID=A0ABN1KDE6_9BURK|nr:hypothetical protein [Ideonella azotifigens]MCD2345016.1 hypothetical protein [Ideonella azotifigens]